MSRMALCGRVFRGVGNDGLHRFRCLSSGPGKPPSGPQFWEEEMANMTTTDVPEEDDEETMEMAPRKRVQVHTPIDENEAKLFYRANKKYAEKWPQWSQLSLEESQLQGEDLRQQRLQVFQEMKDTLENCGHFHDKTKHRLLEIASQTLQEDPNKYATSWD